MVDSDRLSLAHVLLVDDDPFNFELEKRLLGADNYRFSTALSGEECLARIQADRPDVILLDIVMPGLDGIETCRRIRQDEHGNDYLIIFVSAQDKPEIRLRAYDAGGDDFMLKPLTTEEIRRKVEMALKNRMECAALRRSLAETEQMAMLALTASGENGLVLRGFEKFFTCQTYESLARAILEATGQYKLQATVQLRAGKDLVTLNSEGRCSLMEQELLANLCQEGQRLFDYGTRTVLCYPHITLLLKNMPTADEERHGRLKDNLALLAEGANVRMHALINEIAVRKRQQQLAAVIELSRHALSELDARYKYNQSLTASLLTDLETKVEFSFARLGLSEPQEAALMDFVRPLAARATQAYDEGLQIDNQLQAVLQSLRQAITE